MGRLCQTTLVPSKEAHLSPYTLYLLEFLRKYLRELASYENTIVCLKVHLLFQLTTVLMVFEVLAFGKESGQHKKFGVVGRYMISITYQYASGSKKNVVPLKTLFLE